MRDLVQHIRQSHFARIPADSMQSLLEGIGPLTDWQSFSDSWNSLATDTFMADKGRYRQRRYGVYTITATTIQREPHQAHFQTLDYNPLNGGIERWFEPMQEDVSESRTMQTVLRFTASLCAQLDPDKTTWHAEVHQFRILARSGEAGQPTPEGLHRDGRDYVLVLMIRRENIASGETSIHDLDKKHLGSFTLTNPLDAAFVNDREVYHGVTAVTPLDPEKPAYRDVLVVTLAAR